METLPDQFDDALKRIEISDAKRERVIEAHTEIRTLLEGDERLGVWGVDTVLIGSYARHTGIHPGKDVDVFTKLTRLDVTTDPSLVFEVVWIVLAEHYGDLAERQARSIKVSFDDGDDFAVDVVPAVRFGTRWGIPHRDSVHWVDPDPNARWVETDPEQLTALTRAMNATLNIDGRGAYVPTIKLVRQTRGHHRSEKKPGGLYFELLAYWAFAAGVDGESFAEIFAATLRAIAVQLESTIPLVDPVLQRPFEPEPSPSERAESAEVFAGLATRAELALTLPRCRAATVWREILGTNDRGYCFPLPPGCDEQGNEIRRITSVVSSGSREASPFA